ncbi:MAG: hypothetical protein IT273_14625 [Chitinophagales bacterium]|nr:hypothetical protein [Chitinophagales bacterium]
MKFDSLQLFGLITLAILIFIVATQLNSRLFEKEEDESGNDDDTSTPTGITRSYTSIPRINPYYGTVNLRQRNGGLLALASR